MTMESVMRAILDKQRAAFMDELPVVADTRRDRLKRAVAMIVDNQQRFCDALSEDFGHRSQEQSLLTDIAASVGPLKHALKHLDQWMKPEKKPVQFPLGLLGGKAWVEYQPKGVIGIIAPWNFPVNLVMSPLAGVLAAGNRAMVKTSEYTPKVAALFEELAGGYFEPSEVAFVSGGPDVGKAFAELPFDHLLFTGATGIAKHILHAAADHLVPVTLELGGKSPVIVGRSADMAQATERVVMGKMMNAGQICLAPDYMLVPADREEDAVAGLTRAASALYPTLIDNADYTSIINDRHHQRLTEWVEDARAKGAEVIVVNPANEDFGASNTRKMPLHIVRNATDDMTVMQEEIFGPILPVRRYDRIEQAVEEVNRGDRARPAARALSFRARRGRAPPCSGPHDFGRRDARRRDLSCQPGGTAVRRDRAVGDGRLSWRGGVPHLQPRAQHLSPAAHRRREAGGAEAALWPGDAQDHRAPDGSVTRRLCGGGAWR
jgi:coniferyl-aldehyde dehydrogenase